MGRHKQFDPEKLLESAMFLFWSNGYENTSMSDLLKTLKINRWSLYETFGDKQTLFRASLDLYRQRRREEIQRILSSHLDSPLKALAEFVKKSIDEVASNNDAKGCLVTNSAFEIHIFDKEVQEALREAHRNLEDVLYEMIKAAQAKGEVPSEKEARSLAVNTLCMINGARVLARLKDNRETLATLTLTILSNIKQ